jgi:small subunit ribosomal protein S9
MTDGRYFHGTGRRKSSVARVRLYPGAGEHTINDKPLGEVFTRIKHRHDILRPLELTNSQDKFHAQIKVAGGGITGWADAIRHGMARALVAADGSMLKVLRQNGMLTRDSRVKERKKYGLKRARKAPQYTKR